MRATITQDELAMLEALDSKAAKKRQQAELLGARLRHLRLARGASQDQCARAIDTSRPAYTLVERGARALSLFEAAALAACFGVTIGTLLPRSARGKKSRDAAPACCEAHARGSSSANPCGSIVKR